MSNQQLTDELHKAIFRKFEKHKAYLYFTDNIWVANLLIWVADMQLISKCNIRIRLLLCVIDIYGKSIWVLPLKNKKGIAITNIFLKILGKSKRKPNYI